MLQEDIFRSNTQTHLRIQNENLCAQVEAPEVLFEQTKTETILKFCSSEFRLEFVVCVFILRGQSLS